MGQERYLKVLWAPQLLSSKQMGAFLQYEVSNCQWKKKSLWDRSWGRHGSQWKLTMWGGSRTKMMKTVWWPLWRRNENFSVQILTKTSKVLQPKRSCHLKYRGRFVEIQQKAKISWTHLLIRDYVLEQRITSSFAILCHRTKPWLLLVCTRWD